VLTDGAGIEAQERLQIIERTHDGFELSEEDLRIRGPGDYLGTRQSGMPDLKVATIRDVELMQFAKVEAADLLEVDPQLQKRAHRPLASLVKTQLKKMTGTLS
jgi:ATP-dependent DNA helicase RecG